MTMKQWVRLNALLFFVSALASAPLVFAQDNQPAPPDTDKKDNGTAEEAKTPSSQEVEVNEDTYRQFMELKDANRPGDIIPETAFKPGSGLQKLDKLPEESQKHLRNELREIIVSGDPWQPGDENTDYPYTPSAAASKNPALQKQEMEAWGELVDSYNQREAQIYADRAGNRATLSPQDGQGGQPGSGGGKEGKDGQDEAGLAGQPTEQENNPDSDETAGAYSPDAVHDPNAQNASGVSQNALEFLKGLGGSGEKPGMQPGDGGQQGTMQAGQQIDASQAGSAASAAQSTSADTQPGTAGASQNAMEFLDRSNAQAGNTESGGQDSGSKDAAQSEQGQSGSANAQAKAQQSGQGNEQATAQNSGQDTAQGEESVDGAENQEQGVGQSGSRPEGKTLVSQQTETAKKEIVIPPVPDDDMRFSTSEAEEESTAGTTQNALEFLNSGNAQNEETTDDAAVTGPPPSGTLSIQDLLNAQGLGKPPVTETSGSAPGEGKLPDEPMTDKDGHHK